MLHTSFGREICHVCFCIVMALLGLSVSSIHWFLGEHIKILARFNITWALLAYVKRYVSSNGGRGGSRHGLLSLKRT